MTKINIDITSIITQEDEMETFNKQAIGEKIQDDDIIRISYLEDGKIPVKILLKDNELIIKRGVGKNNYSFMRFTVGQKQKCRYVVSGRQVDLLSATKLLNFVEEDAKQKVRIEYDLFSGLYLIGNYTVTLIFT